MNQIAQLLGVETLKPWRKHWEDRFQKGIPSVVTKVPTNIYNMWVSEIDIRCYQEPRHLTDRCRWLINSYMTKHHPSHKIQAMCEVGMEHAALFSEHTGKPIATGFYIKHRQMTVRELKEHDAVQPLYAQTEHHGLLQADPMWLLESSSTDFRSELNITNG